MFNYYSKLKISLITLLFPALIFFLVGPLEIYSGNKEEFLFGVKDFFWIFFLIFLLVLVIGSLIISIFPNKLHSIIISIIFSVSILFYIQNMFLNRKLMDDAGNAMDWNKLRPTIIRNTIIWIIGFIVLCTISYILKDKRNKVLSYIGLSLSFIQIIAVIILISSTGLKGIGKNELVLSGEQQFQYAPNENIVVIVLDAYARDEFINTGNRYPEIKDCLKDFTFYDNADCGYYYTVPAMMHLLTGEKVDFDNYHGDWKSGMWNTNKCINFYNTLHEDGYTCRLYSSKEAHTYFGNFKNLQGKFDNFTYAEPRKDYKLMATLLEKMTIYKYAPYIAKPNFEVMTYSFNDTIVYDHFNNSVAYENYEVMDALNEKGISINNDMTNSFTVMHIQGNHFPYTLDENGNRCKESSPQAMQRGLSVLLSRYFEELKEEGLYDNTTIIITADHGLEFGYYEPQPILLVKKKNEHHDSIIVNSAPVSHDDFQATILSIIDEDYSEYGTSIFDIEQNQKREREVNFNIGENDSICIFSYSTDEKELVQHMKNMDCQIIPTK